MVIKVNKTNFYNATNNLKRSLLAYTERIAKGLTKPEFRFVFDMLYGMMVAQDCKLSKIAEALNEPLDLKCTHVRLQRNLRDFDKQDVIADNYMNKVVKKCRKDSVLIIDEGDIIKPYGTKFEGLCRVRDGSTGKIEKGLPTVGVIALTDDKLPLPVYENIFSYTGDEFESINKETFKALDFADNYFDKENIRVFDRGYDSRIVTEKLLKSEVKFIVRANDVRTIIWGGKKRNISDVAKQFKGRYSMKFENQKGEVANCKIWITPIKLPAFPEKELNLVICNGFGKKPLMLITNVFDDDNKVCKTIVKCYLMRWKIEEFYRFKKQQFNFEDIRVLSLKTMNDLNLLLNILIGFLSMKSTNKSDKPIIIFLINQTKRLFEAKNCLYAVCAGIVVCFAKVNLGIGHYFRKKEFRQLCMFDDFNRYGLCY